MEEQEKLGPQTPRRSSSESLPDLIPHEWTQRPWYIRFPLALLGMVLVVAGMLFWLMPVVPGFFLVPIGLVLIAASSRTVARWVNRAERHLPLRVRHVLHHPLRRHRPRKPRGNRKVPEYVE